MRCVSRLPPLGQHAAAPGLAYVLGCPAGYAWPRPPGKGKGGYLTCSLPNRNPIMMGFLVGQTYTRAFGPRTLVLSYRLRAACAEAALPAAAVLGALLAGAAAPGKSSVTVSPPPGVSARLAVPPLAVTSRCTMARPSPVPPGLMVVNRRKARWRSSALMPGPLSPTVIRAPDGVAEVASVTWSPGLSASRALAIRLSRICSRCPSPIQATAGPSAEVPDGPENPPASLLIPRAPDAPAPPPAGVAASAMSRSSATGSHARTRSPAT